MTKKCSCLTLVSSLFPTNFDLDGMILLLLLMFFPHGAIEIKNEVTNKVLKVNGHQLKLFHESSHVEEEFVVDLSLVLAILCDDEP